MTIALAAAGVVLCVAGFFGWKYFSNAKSPEAPPSTATVAPKTEGTKPGANPATAAAPAAAETAPTPVATEQVAKTDPVPPRPEPARPAPVAPTETRLPSNTSHSAPTALAPGVTANLPVPNTNASPEFRAWVANVKISGVFQGANSRAFINGQMTRVGDPVDSRLGIVFEGIDPEKKQIIFKDATGATATRKY